MYFRQGHCLPSDSMSDKRLAIIFKEQEVIWVVLEIYELLALKFLSMCLCLENTGD